MAPFLNQSTPSILPRAPSPTEAQSRQQQCQKESQTWETTRHSRGLSRPATGAPDGSAGGSAEGARMHAPSLPIPSFCPISPILPPACPLPMPRPPPPLPQGLYPLVLIDHCKSVTNSRNLDALAACRSEQGEDTPTSCFFCSFICSFLLSLFCCFSPLCCSSYRSSPFCQHHHSLLSLCSVSFPLSLSPSPFIFFFSLPLQDTPPPGPHAPPPREIRPSVRIEDRIRSRVTSPFLAAEIWPHNDERSRDL